jgi:hypothetical protein
VHKFDPFFCGPARLGEMMAGTDRIKAKRAADATQKMIKLDITALQTAYEGTSA